MAKQIRHDEAARRKGGPPGADNAGTIDTDTLRLDGPLRITALVRFRLNLLRPSV